MFREEWKASLQVSGWWMVLERNKPNGEIFHRCLAWWEGPRCERRMMNIPYKPLSERMLQEPFWLGLITVFVVLAFIGLVWCAKRHFPEKIEKLLAEEAERNRRKCQTVLKIDVNSSTHHYFFLFFNVQHRAYTVIITIIHRYVNNCNSPLRTRHRNRRPRHRVHHVRYSADWVYENHQF